MTTKNYGVPFHHFNHKYTLLSGLSRIIHKLYALHENMTYQIYGIYVNIIYVYHRTHPFWKGALI